MQSSSQLRHSGRSSLASYPSCQRVQPQTLHVGYMQSSQIDPSISASTQSSIPLPAAYPAHSYVPHLLPFLDIIQLIAFVNLHARLLKAAIILTSQALLTFHRS
ncbi:hypothetical protein TNCV_1998761 [Trichonephila clavipes]|nr:hypothetical protein TNCV_1998761 [Trichonephila clavipes]